MTFSEDILENMQLLAGSVVFVILSPIIIPAILYDRYGPPAKARRKADEETERKFLEILRTKRYEELFLNTELSDKDIIYGIRKSIINMYGAFDYPLLCFVLDNVENPCVQRTGNPLSDLSALLFNEILYQCLTPAGRYMYCSDYYRFILEYLEIEPQRKFEDIINNCETDNFMAVKNELQRAYRAKKYKEVAPLITAFRLGVYDTNSPVHLLNNDVISIIQEKLVQ